MFHRITLVGFVGQAPQMRYTEEGTPVTNFSVATCIFRRNRPCVPAMPSTCRSEATLARSLYIKWSAWAREN